MADLGGSLREKFKRILGSQAEPVEVPPLQAPASIEPKEMIQMEASAPPPPQEEVVPVDLGERLQISNTYQPIQRTDAPINVKERFALLLQKEKGLTTDPLEPEKAPNPIRAYMQAKVPGFEDPFKKFRYESGDGLRPTGLPLDPTAEALYNNESTRTRLDDDEAEYTRKSRLGMSNWVRDAARIATTSENWAPFFNRFGSGAVKGATFNVVDKTEEAKKQVDELGEQWLKESALPEFSGEVSGMLAGGGPVLRAGGAALKMGGKALGNFGAYLFGAKATQAAKAAVSTVETLSQTNAATRVGSAVVKGAASEGALGAAIGLAQDPDEGETRIDNAIQDALIFAGLGALIRGGVEVAKVRADKRLVTAVDKLADDLQISKVEAEGIILEKTGAERIKNVSAEQVDDIVRADLKEGLNQLQTNKGVVALSEREGISLLEAAKKIQTKNPSAPLDLKLFKAADDAEAAADSYKSFFEKNILGEVDGRLTLMPTHKALEKSGQWLFDAEGIALAPGIKIKNIGKSDIRDLRRFLIGERSAAAESYLSDKSKLLSTKRSLQNDALSLIKETESGVTKIAKEKGIGRSAVSQRLAQILEGSVTKDPALKYLGEQYVKLHHPLENELRELSILGDTRFLAKTKEKISGLTAQQDAVINKLVKPIRSGAGKKLVSQELREKEFESVEELKSYLKTKDATKDISESELQSLFDSSRFIRSSYRNAGREHLGRYYQAHAEGRKSALGYFLKAEGGPVNKARFKERLDLPSEVRESLGEIDDVTYRAGKTIFDQIEAVHRGRFQQTISRNPLIAQPASSKKIGGVTKINAEAERLIKEEGWEHLPKDERWGDLADHVVAPHVAKDIKSMGIVPGSEGQNALVSAYKKTLSLWKEGKVVWNPATHFRNMMSSSVMLDMSGVSYLEQATLMPRAAKEFASKGSIYKEALEDGIFGNEFISKEVGDILENALKRSSQSAEGFQNAFLEVAKPSFVNRVRLKASEFYQAEDQVVKLAKYMHMRGEGYGRDVAKREAEKWLFNYSDVPEAIRLAKDYYSPFITYSSKAIPRFFETVIERPWKLVKYAAAFNAVGNLGSALDELEDSKFGAVSTLANFLPDEMKRESYAYPQWRTESVLPSWAQTRLTSVGWPLGWLPENVEKGFKKAGQTVPRLVRAPFQDKYGRELWLDLTYILPFGDLGEAPSRSVLDIPRVLFPQHPALDIVQGFQTNRDPFFGKEIALENDPYKASKYMQFVGKTLAPGLFPGGYSFDKLLSAVKKQEDAQGRLRSLPIALLDVGLGLKLRPFDPDEEMSMRLKEKERSIEDIQGEMRRLSVLFGRNAISEEELMERTEVYIKTIEDIAEDMGVLSNFGEK